MAGNLMCSALGQVCSCEANTRPASDTLAVSWTSRSRQLAADTCCGFGSWAGRCLVLLSCAGGSATLHDAKMHPDLQHAFLNNHQFPVPCFDENTTTEQLCQAVHLNEVGAVMLTASFLPSGSLLQCQLCNPESETAIPRPSARQDCCPGKTGFCIICCSCSSWRRRAAMAPAACLGRRARVGAAPSCRHCFWPAQHRCRVLLSLSFDLVCCDDAGKTFTMGGILQHSAAALFGGEAHAAPFPVRRRSVPVILQHARRIPGPLTTEQPQRASLACRPAPRRVSLSVVSPRGAAENRDPEVLGATEVRVACFEVCGKQCYDLLKSGEKLVVREDASGAVQASAHGQYSNAY